MAKLLSGLLFVIFAVCFTCQPARAQSNNVTSLYWGCAQEAFNQNFFCAKWAMTTTPPPYPTYGGGLLGYINSWNDDCSVPAPAGLTMCIWFEAADTTFEGQQPGHVTSKTYQSMNSSVAWDAQNLDSDRASQSPPNDRIGLISGGRDGSFAIRFQTMDNDINVHG